jgi:hypothetical protein
MLILSSLLAKQLDMLKCLNLGILINKTKPNSYDSNNYYPIYFFSNKPYLGLFDNQVWQAR